MIMRINIIPSGSLVTQFLHRSVKGTGLTACSLTSDNWMSFCSSVHLWPFDYRSDQRISHKSVGWKSIPFDCFS